MSLKWATGDSSQSFDSDFLVHISDVKPYHLRTVFFFFTVTGLNWMGLCAAQVHPGSSLSAFLAHV